MTLYFTIGELNGLGNLLWTSLNHFCEQSPRENPSKAPLSQRGFIWVYGRCIYDKGGFQPTTLFQSNMAMEHVQFIDDFLIQQHCIGDFPAMFHYRAVPGAPLGRVFLDATSRQPLEVMSTAPMGMAPMEKRPGVEAIVAGCLMDLISFIGWWLMDINES